jgi:hypothetical protein
MLCVIVPVSVLLIMAFVNIFAIVTFDSKLNFIASQAVKVRSENLYWLGMPRSDIDPNQADSEAENFAVAMATAAGIDLAVTDVKFATVTLTSGGYSFTGERCTITAKGVKLPFGGNTVFPLVVPQTVVVTSASDAVPPPCVAQYNSSYNLNQSVSMGTLGDNPKGANVSLFMPCYGALYQPTNDPSVNGAPTAVPTGNMPVPNSIRTKAMACVINVGNATGFLSIDQ